MVDSARLRQELDRLRAVGLTQRDYARLLDGAGGLSERDFAETLRAAQTFAVSEDAINQEARTVVVSFADESVVPRWWGNLIVEQSEDAVDFSRLNNGAPVLLNHDDGTGFVTDPLNHVGVVEEAWLDSDKVSRARLRFGRSERAELVFRDVVDGIRRKISMGFAIRKLVLVEESEDEPSLYRATMWAPHELSFVPVPAIDSVGVGLNRDTAAPRIEEAALPEKGVTMPEELKTAPADELETARAEGQKAERERRDRIAKLGAKYGRAELAQKHIDAGSSFDVFRDELLESLGDQAPLRPVDRDARIGLTDREADQFRLMRLVRFMADPSNIALREAASFELEACAAAADRLGKKGEIGRFTVPSDVLGRFVDMNHARERFTGASSLTGEAGGYTIGKQIGGYIELLREQLVLAQMGVKIIPDLVGDVGYPKLTGGATAYWVDDTADLTDSTPTWGELELRPRTVGARMPISRRLLKQDSIGIEMLLREDLVAQIANGIQIAAINGSGGRANILGLLKTTGIGSVAGGTDGAAPTYAHMVQLEGDVAVGKALASGAAFLTNNKVRSQLRQTAESATMAAAGWVYKAYPGVPGLGEIIGYPCYTTGDVPSTLVKGSSGAVCSAIIFGVWPQMLLALWGGLDLEIDKSTNIKSGGIVLQGLQDVDAGLRQPAAFSAMQDALTASA